MDNIKLKPKTTNIGAYLKRLGELKLPDFHMTFDPVFKDAERKDKINILGMPKEKPSDSIELF